VKPPVAALLVPPGVDTFTLTFVETRKLDAGVVPVMLVSEMLVIVRLPTPANATVVFPAVGSKPVPVIVTDVPPPSGPAAGAEREPLIVGIGS
jgi:hypothetical protein